MSEYLPPFFGEAPAATCSRVGCGTPAMYHVIWTVDVVNGLVCAEHLAETRRQWAFYAVHEYQQAFCSHPRAVYHHDLNECAIPLEDVDWDTAAAEELEVSK